MTNISDTELYCLKDHLASLAVRSLSRLIGVKRLTIPFWNRWRASLIGDEIISEFLAHIKSFDDWPCTALQFVERAAAELSDRADTRSPEETVHLLRRLSYLAHLAEWGCLPITENKVAAYVRSRDYYIQAETLAHGERFRRVKIPWASKACWGNLHLPSDCPGPFPLVIIVHGMDDTKEEHLATELCLQSNGFATFCFDGPGQGESFLLEGLTWPVDFEDSIVRVIDVLGEAYPCDPGRVGLVGISWGGFWAVKAAKDRRVRAVYDLGGPVDANGFSRLPFFLKTKFCQVLGIHHTAEVPEVHRVFSLKVPGPLKSVGCPVRIVHGDRDPLVPTSDKEWLQATLQSLHPDQDVTLRVFRDGDHCCTTYGAEIREDAIAFFNDKLKI